MKILTISVLILLAALVAIGLYLYHYDILSIKDVLLNLFAEIIGILLTLILVDQLLAASQERERRRVARTALRSFGKPLRSHINLLCDILKASTTSIPTQAEADLRTLLLKNLPDEIQFFDFTASGPTHPPEPWANHISNKFQNFSDAVEKIVEKYSTFLQPQLLEALELVAGVDILAIYDRSGVCNSKR